jgi:enoyl-CoA hydratase/carnithine racemase
LAHLTGHVARCVVIAWPATPACVEPCQDLPMSDEPSETPADDLVLVTDADGVRTVTMNRPDALNAFNQALWCAVRDALAGAADDPEIRCVVLTGAGRAFTAGQDLTEMADPSVFTPTDGSERPEPGYRQLMRVLETFPKPLLAAVNGVGVGIGLTILPHCDIVFIAEGARLKAPFVSLGVTTEASASLLLPATIGWQEAALLLFTEPWIDATEAVRLGLALRCVPDADLLDEIMVVARQIGAMAVEPLTTTKRMMLAARGSSVTDAREREEREFARLVGAPENRAALDSFMAR